MLIDRLLCGLTRHRGAMRTFHEGRMYLTCHACGWTSPGWQVGKPAKARTVVGFRVPQRARRQKVA